MKKQTSLYDTSIRLLSRNDHISGILTVYRDKLDEDLRASVNWDVFLVIIEDYPTSTLWSPVWLQGKCEQRIMIIHLTLSELQKEDCMEHEEMRGWMQYAAIAFDRYGHLGWYMQGLPRKCDKCQEQRLLIKFTAFFRAYMESKHHIVNRQYLDAFTAAEQALLELARLSIIEHGKEPNTMLWQQVRILDLGVLKLYEELVMSTESIHQRVELVLLACEFIISTRMLNYLTPLVRVLSESKDGMTLHQLQQHDNLKRVMHDIPLLLDTLIKRGCVETSLVNPDHYWLGVGLMPIYCWNSERDAVL